MDKFFILKFDDGLEIIVYSSNIKLYKEYFSLGAFDLPALLQYCRVNNIKAFATGKDISIKLIEKADNMIKMYGVEMNETQLMIMGQQLFGLDKNQLNNMK